MLGKEGAETWMPGRKCLSTKLAVRRSNGVIARRSTDQMPEKLLEAGERKNRSTEEGAGDKICAKGRN